MENFRAIENDEEIFFRLEIHADLTVGINMLFRDGMWIWDYMAWIDSIQEDGFNIKLEGNNFHLKKKISIDVNDYFYKCLREIKNHPKYRLRVLNKLNDEIKSVWNQI